MAIVSLGICVMRGVISNGSLAVCGSDNADKAHMYCIRSLCLALSPALIIAIHCMFHVPDPSAAEITAATLMFAMLFGALCLQVCQHLTVATLNSSQRVGITGSDIREVHSPPWSIAQPIKSELSSCARHPHVKLSYVP